MHSVLRRPATLTAVAIGILLAVVHGRSLMAREAPSYTVLATRDPFEIRRYQPHVVAETTVEGSFDAAGDEAFRRLAGFIFGNNDGGRAAAVTTRAAVDGAAQTAEGTRIAMTVPVSMDRRDGRWVMAFPMPSRFTLATLPKPADPRVTLREQPGEIVAALRFSGRGNESAFEEKAALLRAALRDADIGTAEPPVLARYDAPWTPWFLRRNEVLIRLEGWPE